MSKLTRGQLEHIQDVILNPLTAITYVADEMPEGVNKQIVKKMIQKMTKAINDLKEKEDFPEIKLSEEAKTIIHVKVKKD